MIFSFYYFWFIRVILKKLEASNKQKDAEILRLSDCNSKIFDEEKVMGNKILTSFCFQYSVTEARIREDHHQTVDGIRPKHENRQE